MLALILWGLVKNKVFTPEQADKITVGVMCKVIPDNWREVEKQVDSILNEK